MYKCGVCNRTLKKIGSEKVRCPYCGSRILFKERSEIVRTIKAR